MEHVAEAARRALEFLLDDIVEFVADLPEGKQRARLCECVNRLEEELMASAPV